MDPIVIAQLVDMGVGLTAKLISSYKNNAGKTVMIVEYVADTTLLDEATSQAANRLLAELDATKP